ncbi:MAG: UDP-galactopyranose mutase [Parahaliea sp.]
MKLLIVGAGFSGATIAQQLAASGQHTVDIIDTRSHIAGNAHDPVSEVSGARYHQYGPHIFHTNSREIVDYLSQFTDWLPYRHRVQALLPSGELAPMPLNRTTLSALYGRSLESEADVRELLAGLRVAIAKPGNALEHLYSIYGPELTELFFGRYTRKMWALELSNMPISVVARIPVRYDDDPHYFNDEFQMMPKEGYTALVECMLEHPAISVRLNTAFDKAMEADYDFVFNSMPIDEYFDNIFGPLPYRSIRFEHRYNEAFDANVPTVNFTDDGPHTRKTSWALYPACGGAPGEHVTYEIPCSYEDNNMERYYPVKTVDGWPQQRYKQYEALARQKDNMMFIGRCGQYVYYDIHQAVANSLMLARRFLDQHP